MVRFSWLFSRCSVSPLIHTARDRKRKSQKPKNLCQTPALRRSDTPMIPQAMRFSIQIPDFHAHTNNRFQKIYAKFIFPIIRGNRKLHYLRNSTIAPERLEGAVLAFSAYDPCHLSSGWCEAILWPFSHELGCGKNEILIQVPEFSWQPSLRSWSQSGMPSEKLVVM